MLKVGLEPTRLAAMVFETTASAVPPLEHIIQGLKSFNNYSQPPQPHRLFALHILSGFKEAVVVQESQLACAVLIHRSYSSGVRRDASIKTYL